MPITIAAAGPGRYGRRVTGAVDSLGLIAGNRSLPIEFARLLRAAGTPRLVAVAFEGETDAALATLVDEIVWVHVGQLSKMIAVFAKRGVKQCVMLGQIAPTNLFDLRPDLRALKLLWRLGEKNAHSIFGAIAEELRHDGIELVEPTPWLRPLMPGAGFRLGPALTTEQEADVHYGWRIAKEISRLEIGQTVVVKRGTVLAVEGFEGTDRCLTRGGQLAGKDGGAVAIKVTKAGHDMRFDIPTVGLKTVETCAASGVAVLAVEANKTILLEQELIREFAPRRGVTVQAVEGAVSATA